MSGDAPDGGPGPDEESDPAESFLDGVRDAHLRPDGGRRAGGSYTPTDRRGEPVGPRREAGAGTRRSELDPGRTHRWLEPSCPVTAAIRDSTVLDAVANVGPATERRYGTERPVRGRDDGVSRRTAVRACRRPDGDREGFTDALAAQLERWAAVSDVDGVVPVLEYGRADRPWVVTASTGSTLRGRDTPTAGRALRQATHLAGALADLHDRGVIHAGIDPGNVVLSDDGDGPPEPSLTNPGLVDVYRRYEDPAAVLDPRYAAPEYFESDSHVVDRATDVYGLGVVCFRLLTGVAPIDGTAKTIARRVTADDPLPRPSRVDSRLPEAIDDVILRATATDRFERFDTARDLHEALAAVRPDN